jgi:hypothetical protein
VLAGMISWQGDYTTKPLSMESGIPFCHFHITTTDSKADQIFDRMLWFNPSDNQGVGFVFYDVKAEILSLFLLESLVRKF